MKSGSGGQAWFWRVLAVVLILLGKLVVLGSEEELRVTGHYDLAVNYEEEGGWDTYIRDYGDGSALEAERIVFGLGESARTEVPDVGGYGFLGEAGEAVWILPEIYEAGQVWLGLGAPLLGRNVFTGGLSNRGELSLRLVEVVGSGVERGGAVALWVSGVPPQVYFASGDGIGPEDALDGITANFHAHYNWGFTAEGRYRLTFEYRGELVEALGGEAVSTRVTYQFAVGEAAWEAGVLRDGREAGGGWAWLDWLGWYGEGADSWIYASRYGWLCIPDGRPEHFWIYAPDWGWGRSGEAIFPRVWLEGAERWVEL